MAAPRPQSKPSPERARSLAPIVRPTRATSIDAERGNDVPLSVQISWQIAYQIDTGQYPEGARLPTVRELAASFRIDPNTVRVVYGRLARAGYVTTRQGSGTYVAARPERPGRGAALTAMVSDLLIRGAQQGFAPDELAMAVYAAAQERKQPGSRVRVLFVDDTQTDASNCAALLAEKFGDVAEVEGALIEEIDARLSSFHYDLVATTPGHAYATQEAVARRRPVVIMLVVPTYSEVLRELSAARSGSTLGLICHSEQGLENMDVTFRSFRGRLNILKAGHDSKDELRRIDAEADLILVTRGAVQLGATEGFSRPGRIREFTGEFDKAGLELLGHAIGAALAQRTQVPEALPVALVPQLSAGSEAIARAEKPRRRRTLAAEALAERGR
jgi:GntR family transcriptional regulator